MGSVHGRPAALKKDSLKLAGPESPKTPKSALLPTSHSKGSPDRSPAGVKSPLLKSPGRLSESNGAFPYFLYSSPQIKEAALSARRNKKVKKKFFHQKLQQFSVMSSAFVN